MDLNHAATFVRVVEAGSFTAAAHALRLPTSSVSRSISRLENDLGVVLLERTTRKIGLTEAGRAYYERARDAVVGLDEASALAVDAAREPHGPVRLCVPTDFGSHLAPLMGAFVARYPRIQVDVLFSSRGAELVGDSVDVAVVVGRLADSSLIVKKIGQAAHRLYASPAYLEARGRPRALADLARHDAVLFRSVAGAGTWELVGPNGRETVKMTAQVSGDQLTFVVEATVAGLGIALLPTFTADPLVADGTLVPVLPRFAALHDLQALVRDTRHLPRRVALLRDFLVEGLSAGCPKSHA
jgi:DNA-binding transcriptional LysR family regulator